MVFGLGANLGRRERTLRWALEHLGRHFAPLRVASLYESSPLRSSPPQSSRADFAAAERGPRVEDQSDYLNTVALGHLAAPLDVRRLLAWLKSLERQAGRRDLGRDAPRPLDIDLLVAGSAYFELPPIGVKGDAGHPSGGVGADLEPWPGAICVPHARIAERRFVLEPLCDLIPEAPLPRWGQSPRQLLAVLGDQQAVERVGWREPF